MSEDAVGVETVALREQRQGVEQQNGGAAGTEGEFEPRIVPFEALLYPPGDGPGDYHSGTFAQMKSTGVSRNSMHVTGPSLYPRLSFPRIDKVP